jgi:O-antigen ligase
VAARLDPSRLTLAALLGCGGLALGLLAGYDPRLAIAAALGIGFVLLILADLTFGVILFALLSFLGLLPTIAGPGLSFPKVVGLLLAISWLAGLATRGVDARDLFTEHGGIGAVLLLFLAWAGISAVWAESAGEVATALYRYGLNLALFPIVYSALRGRQDALWFAGAFLLGAAIAAAYGLAVHPEASSAAGIGGTDELNRISGTIGDPNELAAVLVAGIALALALVAGLRRSPGLRALAGAAGLLCLVSVFFTLSRGGLLALGVALLAGVVVGGRWRPAFALAAIVAVLGAAAYFGAVVSPEQRQRLTAADGGSGRTDIWKVGWRMVEHRPAQGFGAGNFGTSAIHYVVAPGSLRRSDLLVERPQVTHNVYLQMFAELGLVGLALFIAVIVAALGAALRAAQRFRERGDPAMQLLAISTVVALLGMLAADFFLSGQYSKQLWLLLAFGPALLRISAEDSPALP